MNIIQSTAVSAFNRKHKSKIFRQLGLGALLSTLLLVAGIANAALSPYFECTTANNKVSCKGNLAGVIASNQPVSKGNYVTFNSGTSDGKVYFGASYNGNQYMCTLDSAQSNYFRDITLMGDPAGLNFQVDIQYGKCTNVWFLRYVN